MRTFARLAILRPRLRCRPDDCEGDRVEGAIDEIPREGPVILAVEPRLERRRRRPRLVAHARGSAGASTGWARRSCSTGRSSAGWPRDGGVHPVDRGAADVEAFRLAQPDPRRGPRPGRLPRGHAQPRRRAPGGEGRPRRAGAADRRADRAGRDRRHGPGLAARAGSSRIPVRPDVTVRVGRAVPARRRRPGRHGPRAAKAIATTAIMGRIAALLAAAPAGRLRGRGRRGPAPEPDAGTDRRSRVRREAAVR